MDVMLNREQARQVRLAINELLEGSKFILLFKDGDNDHVHVLGNKVPKDQLPVILERTARLLRESPGDGFDTE